MLDPLVRQWLTKLGLSRYEKLFDESEIDWDVLSELSASDMESLAIPFGPRKKLQRAIAAFGTGASMAGTHVGGFRDAEPDPVFSVDQSSAEDAWHTGSKELQVAEMAGERRLIAVVFCDIVGSTALSRRLDPEDLQGIIHAYQRCGKTVVERYGGYIAQYLGDGIMSYFGYPQSHENYAESALRAGLDIVTAMAPLNARFSLEKGAELAVRVGIASGLVVVGEREWNGAVDEARAVGETPNLAARLQAFASPNTVVVSETTHELLADRFEFEPLEAQFLPGMSEPCSIWRGVRPADSERRFNSIRKLGSASLIGRTRELAQIAERWESAVRGDGQVVLLSGEPGIGKTRILSAFEEHAAGVPHRCTRFFCSPFFEDRAFHPVIEQLSRSAGITPDDSEREKRFKLKDRLTECGGSADNVLPVIEDLLGLSPSDDQYLLDVTAQKRREIRLEAVLDRFRRQAESMPILIVFEDIQWIDPTTSELLHRIVEWIPDRNALLIATSRTQFRPTWADEPHVSAIVLNRLGRKSMERLVESIAGSGTLPPEVVAQVIERTDGVPLFVEELTKILINRRMRAAASDQDGKDSDVQRVIPATIHASLMERLDQFDLPKEVAQIASVIGRQFPFSLIASITEIPKHDLERALSELASADLIIRRGEPPFASYTFKHALMQEAAYESLLLSRRRRLHAKIAEMLEKGRDNLRKSCPELLAHHYTESGNIDRAVAYRFQAAQSASDQSAYKEAVNHLRKGLALVKTCADSDINRKRELELLLPLGVALMALKGAGSPEVERTYARALELCAELPESPLHFAAYWGWWRISMDLRTGRNRANDLVALAERLNQTELIMQAHHASWATNFNLGDQKSCLDHIDRGLSLHDASAHAAVYGGHDANVCGEGEAALCLWLLGYPDGARERIKTALDIGRSLSNAASLAHAIDISLMLSRYRRDASAVREQASELMNLAQAKGFPEYVAKAKIFGGWADAMTQVPEAGLATMLSGMAAQRQIGTREDLPVYLEMIAEICHSAGRSRDALRHLDEAISLCETYSINYWTSELHRRRGLVLTDQKDGQDQEAEQSLLSALQIARQQCVRMLELRATLSLAQLHRRQGRASDICAQLKSLLTHFDEGLNEQDLQEAIAFIDSIEHYMPLA